MFRKLIEKIQIKTVLIIEIIHLKIFGHKISHRMREFLQNLSISIIGGFVASGISFGISIFIGRVLGPVEYGNYTLFMTMVASVTIFISLGLETAIIRYNRIQSEKRIQELFSTVFIFFLINASFWLIILFVTRKYWEILFSMSSQLVVIAIFFTIVNVFSIILENALKSLSMFSLVNAIRVSQNLLLLCILVLTFFMRQSLTVVSYGLVFTIVMLFSSGIFFYKIKKYVKFYFSKKLFKELLTFSFISFSGILAGYLIQNGDNLIINYFLGKKILGIYNAYYTLSMMISGQIVVFFVAVYFPAIVATKNKQILFKKIKKIIRVVAIPWVLFNMAVIFTGLKLFGGQYPFDIFLTIFFSLYTLLFLIGQLYGYIIIASKNNQIIKKMYYIWLLIVSLHFLVLIFLARLVNLSVYIILCFYVMTYAFNAILNKYYAKKCFQ